MTPTTWAPSSSAGSSPRRSRAQLLGINAFDQPNVQESKDNTERILKQYESMQRAAAAARRSCSTQTGHVAWWRRGETPPRSCDAVVASSGARRPTRSEAAAGRLLRAAGLHPADAARPRRHCSASACACATRAVTATTLGYGPRFQHSTGQLHKGGPNTGVFLQFVADDALTTWHSRRAVHLRHAQAGAGAGRSAVARGAWSARDPHGSGR